MSNVDGVVVFTTCGSEDKARALASALLERQLVACAQLLPIRSLYTWKGEVADEAEILLLLKTTQHNYDALQAAILELHDYETPEILAAPLIAGSPGYLDWMKQVTV